MFENDNKLERNACGRGLMLSFKIVDLNIGKCECTYLP